MISVSQQSGRPASQESCFEVDSRPAPKGQSGHGRTHPDAWDLAWSLDGVPVPEPPVVTLGARVLAALGARIVGGR